MRRRRLLLGLAAAAPAPLRAILAEPSLHGLLGGTGGLALGRAYLAGLPAPPAAAELAGAVERGLSGRGGLQRQVAALIAQDFTHGRTACVDGWVLALTEARICALAALSAAPSAGPSAGPPAAPDVTSVG